MSVFFDNWNKQDRFVSRLRTIEKPSVLPVSLDELRNHARVDETIENTLLGTLLEVTTAYLDGKDGLLGRSLITQTHEQMMDRFPKQGEFVLPLRPAQAVLSVVYMSDDGVEHTLDPSAYRLVGEDPGELFAVDDWPSTKRDPEAVKVTFRAGYGDTAEDVPAALRQAILEHATALYDTRAAISFASVSHMVPLGFKDLIEPYRVRGFG